MVDDPLTDLGALGQHVKRWRTMLAIGLEASDDDRTIEEIEQRLRTGRPLADAKWIAQTEQALDRKLAYAKPGPKPRRAVAAGRI